MKVIFSTGPHVSSFLLRTALMSEWSHCGVIMVDGETVIEASAKHGVVETPLDKFTRYGRWAIQDVPVPDEAAAFAALREELGKGYDWLGLVGIAFQRDWNHTHRWFCSELVQWAKVSGGLVDLRFDQRRITPRDLWLLPYPVIAFEGVKAGTT